MIQKLIYDRLSQDSTNDNQAAALATIQEAYPSITSLDGIEYTYQSLKTLLGDNSSIWAKNKIIYEQYSNPADMQVANESELPMIGIALNGNLNKLDTSSHRDVQGEIKIDCKTAAIDVSTGLVRKIAFRVRRCLEPIRDNELNQWWHYCNMSLNYSLSEIQLHFLRFEPYLGDKIGLIYRVKATFI